MEHDGTVNDELIAEQMQLAEVETSNHEGEESEKSDDTMNEDEQGEEEEETADEEVLFLTPEMIQEIADKQGFGDMANDLVQTLLTTSDPTQMDTVLQNIKDILALESKKEKLVKSAKARLEKIYRDHRKSHAPKGESIKSVNRSNTYNIEVRFGEHVIHLNLMGKHTFKSLRERLRLLNPDLFSNDSDLKKKLEFYVVGKENLGHMGETLGNSRREMVAWGATSGQTLVINIRRKTQGTTDGTASSSTTTGTTSAGTNTVAKAKAKSKAAGAKTKSKAKAKASSSASGASSSTQ